jgi:dihydropteroate synthase
MHWRGHSTTMQSRAVYADVAGEVVTELAHQVEQAERAGIRPDRLILDPGLGFAKTGEHNWELLQRLDELDRLGRPLLLGVSRKTFLGTLLADETGTPRPAAQRDDATTVLTYVLAGHPVWGVRVHTVRPSRDAIAVAERLRRR